MQNHASSHLLSPVTAFEKSFPPARLGLYECSARVITFSRADINPQHNDFEKTHTTMFRIASSSLVALFALAAASCCCTSDSRPPALRPLPQFQEIEPAQAPYTPSKAPIRGTK